MDKFLNEIWSDSKLVLDMSVKFIANEQDLAVLLATNAKNYDRFVAVNEFRQILSSLGLRASLHGVQTAQVGILNALKHKSISKQKLLNALLLLQNESIIDEYENLKKFIDEIDNDGDNIKNTEQKSYNFFHDKMTKFNTIYNEILNLNPNKNLKNRLAKHKQKLDELKFNIAVTGVINAGKSTLLNAILNAKILGTSNVPETINLTILKHDKKAFAKVLFWDKDELNELGIIPQNELLDYAGKELDIKINELANYTSATKELSKMVKSVILYADLELLNDGVCIVDTPGIDDAIFLREQLVNRFISECDILLHLMNVSQSATEKDVEFLKNSIKNSHITKLIVVLTHADLVSKDELNEVANYTQKSLKNELKDVGLDSFELFCISAKSYFDGAKDSGIDELKTHLYKILFGENSQKAILNLKSYKKELLGVVSEFLNEIKTDMLSLSGGQAALKNRLNMITDSKNALENEFLKANEIAKDELSKIDANALNLDFINALKIASIAIKDRVINEINFSQKNKKSLDKSRIEYIIKSGLNDAIMTLVRQSRNAILKQINTCASNISLNTKFKITPKNEIFNVSEYLAKNSISFNYQSVFQNLNLNGDEKELLMLFDRFLNDEKLKNIILNLLNFEKTSFENELNELINSKKQNLKEELKRLKEELNELSKDDKNALFMLETLKTKESSLNAIISELNNA